MSKSSVSNTVMTSMNHTVKERFLRYVKIDTQSDPSSDSIPSTLKQKNLGKILVAELHEMGITDAHLDEWGYVYATIPATTDKKDVPVICFCSHMDTAPDCTGTNVKPIVHEKWDGQDIDLPDDPEIVISTKKCPALKDQIGKDLITASGTTLLGADNKSGLAAIMDAANHLMAHPEIKHGKIRLLFTPDEEIGRGVQKVDIEKLGADFGYTVDGEAVGTLENETFSANSVEIEIKGVSIHPGFAKGKMEHAIKIAAAIINRLPKDQLSPETTSDKEGFIHPTSINGMLEKATLTFIIRDFVTANLKKHEDSLQRITDEVMAEYPNSTAKFTVTEQYRNMKEVLDQYPQVVANAVKAIKQIGLTPIPSSIRGGTDGSRLSFMGLPCPNIFAGEYAFHGKEEYTSVQDMEKSAEMIVEIAKVWEGEAV